MKPNAPTRWVRNGWSSWSPPMPASRRAPCARSLQAANSRASRWRSRSPPWAWTRCRPWSSTKWIPGIGGAVAEIVGQKLRALGDKRQVLCVTHLPQVAAQGHAHYRVSKAPVDGMTQSSVESLGAKQREEELARMLGGVEVSKEARAAAKRLLSNAM